MIARESALKKGLPKDTQSLCPECQRVISARIFEKDGKVMMEKECPEHGVFSDIYWSDVDLFLKAEKYAFDGVGFTNPNAEDPSEREEKACLCLDKKCYELYSHTSLANVDLTNRCNMRCPICFANANAAGYVFEPDFETIVKMLKMLREEKPVPCTAVQFAGGEPTIYPKFIEVIKAANEMGFAQIQVATNGLRFANEPEFLAEASEAGLNTIYLQFDGLNDEIYMQSRNRKMVAVKNKVIENCRSLKNPPSIVLVPVVVRGVNDDQVGAILDFAIENSDVIRGVNYQPVAFTGRIENEEREKGRYTLTDLAIGIEEQTGYTTKDDWYPVPVVAPISTFVSSMLGEEKVTFTAHPHCGLATYLFIDDNGKVVPITRFIDVDRMITGLYDLTKKAEDAKVKFTYKVKAVNLLKKCIIKENIPEGLNLVNFLKMMDNVLSNQSKEALSDFSWRMMFVGGMHFQDNYNYDVERVRRCVIHYTTPDMRIIPFCAYNGGPTYREEVEKKFSIPVEEWKKKHGDQYC